MPHQRSACASCSMSVEHSEVPRKLGKASERKASRITAALASTCSTMRGASEGGQRASPEIRSPSMSSYSSMARSAAALGSSWCISATSRNSFSSSRSADRSLRLRYCCSGLRTSAPGCTSRLLSTRPGVLAHIQQLSACCHAVMSSSARRTRPFSTSTAANPVAFGAIHTDPSLRCGTKLPPSCTLAAAPPTSPACPLAYQTTSLLC
mmetsp:Transcript_7023/g.23072  ORF Transcript_7023/g.23072 Transcript_7023/m.23072 type:complete len:208 (+) Transcript_7023:397-1020(+)